MLPFFTISKTGFDPNEAAAYYDGEAISGFYQKCWGGEDIHIGRYPTGNESIAEASADMTRHLLECAGIGEGQRVLDIAQPAETSLVFPFGVSREPVDAAGAAHAGANGMPG